MFVPLCSEILNAIILYKVKRKILILLFLLSFPSVLYVVLTTGKHNALRLPYFGEKHIAANGKDTIYHTVPEFAFVNQHGDTITGKFYDNKIYVADYFYTTCPTKACPRMAAQMLRIQERFAYTEGLVQMLSHTVNPEADSVPALNNYANAVHADTKMWNFVTGDKSSLYNIAREGYMIQLTDSDSSANIPHSPSFVLVDKEKHIRGIYDGTKLKGVNDLIDDIKALMAEYVIKETERKKIEQKKKI